jgi:sugar/nucleoside kinase (ribokinase family)
VPGGSAANVLKGLARVSGGELACRLLGMVGADEAGALYTEQLRRQGVEPMLLVRVRWQTGRGCAVLKAHKPCTGVQRLLSMAWSALHGHEARLTPARVARAPVSPFTPPSPPHSPPDEHERRPDRALSVPGDA